MWRQLHEHAEAEGISLGICAVSAARAKPKAVSHDSTLPGQYLRGADHRGKADGMKMSRRTSASDLLTSFWVAHGSAMSYLAPSCVHGRALSPKNLPAAQG